MIDERVCLAALCELRSRAVRQQFRCREAIISLRDTTVPSTHAPRGIEIVSITMENGISERTKFDSWYSVHAPYGRLCYLCTKAIYTATQACVKAV